MTILSTDHKFLMVHITKCAGSSLSETLSNMVGYSLAPGIRKSITDDGIGGGVPEQLRPFDISVHDPLFEIERKVAGNIDLDSYFKFCFVRNPWSRIFSFYQHKVRRNDPDLPRHRRSRQPLSFNECIRTSNILLLQPQTWWTESACGEDGIDFIGRFENLDEDFATISRHLGFDPLPLGRRNASISSKYQVEYDDYSKRVIEHFYKHEIELFGYTFDS